MDEKPILEDEFTMQDKPIMEDKPTVENKPVTSKKPIIGDEFMDDSSATMHHSQDSQDSQELTDQGPVTDYSSTVINWMRNRKPAYQGSYRGEAEQPSPSYIVDVSTSTPKPHPALLLTCPPRCCLPMLDFRRCATRFPSATSIRRSIRLSTPSTLCDGLPRAAVF